MNSKKFISEIRNKASKYFIKNNIDAAECGYILDNYHNWDKNIIEPSVALYIQEEIKRRIEEKSCNTFALHKYIHHGLSSQACIFNLLGPFIANRDYKILKDIIGISGLNMKGDFKNVVFEHTEREMFGELQQQPTSIDLYLETTESEKVICEFKFTESEFGTCSVYEDGDCDGLNPKDNLNLCYLHRDKKRKYMNFMGKYNLFWDSNPCQFTEFYQAYRLLLFALEKNGCFLLIYDERNPAFIYEENGIKRGKFVRFVDLLPEEIRLRVFKLSIQEIVRYLEQEINPTWIDKFKEKYL